MKVQVRQSHLLEEGSLLPFTAAEEQCTDQIIDLKKKKVQKAQHSVYARISNTNILLLLCAFFNILVTTPVSSAGIYLDGVPGVSWPC